MNRRVVGALTGFLLSGAFGAAAVGGLTAQETDTIRATDSTAATDTLPAGDTLAATGPSGSDSAAAAGEPGDTVPGPRADSVPPLYPPESVQPDSAAAPLPFGPGERLEYKVKIGWFNAGQGELTLMGVDTIRGRTAYRALMHVQGSWLGLGVNDRYHSWFDLETLQSWRFIRDIHEVTYHSYRHYEMWPERGTWEREDNDEFGDLGSLLPLDDIAFIYYMRNLPLVPGETYTVDRYFKTDGNPIQVEVLRADERDAEGVKYQTVVVRPRVQTDGLFGEDGEAEIHLTNDEFHYPVYMKFDIPNFPGSLTLHLRSIEEGLPVNPEAREAALARRAQEGGEGNDGR